MHPKTISLDTSSAILLFKSGLSELLLQNVNTVLTPSVQQELTQPGYSGASYYQKHINAGLITIVDPSFYSIPQAQLSQISPLHPGEKDTIILLLKNLVSFIITDDKKAAQTCMVLLRSAGQPDQ